MQQVSKYETSQFRMGYVWDCIEYPVDLKDIPKFERANNISINVFGLTDKNEVYPLKIVDDELQDHSDLLYIMNGRESIYICKRCLTHYHNELRLEEHKKLCSATGELSKIVMPDEMNNTLKCTHLNYSFRVPYVIYADFECILENISTCEPSSHTSYTNSIQKHEPFSFCYFIVTPEGCQSPQLYRGPNAARVFIQCIKDEAEKIYTLYKNSIPMNPLTAEEETAFHETSLCHICGKELRDVRVRDHDHLTGKFRGVAHQFCNMQYKIPNFLPVFIHNLSSYDGHFLVNELDYDDRKIFSVESNFSIRFIDACRFIHASLATLVSNLSEFKYTSEVFGEKTSLVTYKGVYPYDFMDSIDKLEETSLPERENFYNRLTDEHVSEEDYEHANNVWNSFQCKTLGDYSDVYLKSDVTLLADVFKNFRDVCFNAYKLDPAWYYTAPGLTFDAMLKHTEIELELLTDYDMILMIEKGIRGGISQCSNRYCKANNKYLENYNPEKGSTFITYYDANNLYGWALFRPLPFSYFRWLNREEIAALEIENVPEQGKKGYILKVDLEYPQNLHDEHSDLPLCPENNTPPGGKHRKLLTMLENKEKNVIHYMNLNQAISLCIVLKKIHRVLEFDQSPWLKSYIDLNTDRRKSAKNEFEKDFYKLMNNAVFGKTMENVRKRINLELVTSEKRLDKLISKSTFLDRTIFTESLVAVHLRKSIIKMNKPIYIGFCVLYLSKTLMYDFHYRVMLPKYKTRLSLAYTDTDSFIYSIKMNDINEDMLDNLDMFDTSNYPKEHLCYSDKNKKIIGKLKDECNGKVMTHFIGLRSKLYSFKVEGGKEKKKAKGITKAVKEKSLNFDDYVRCLHEKLTEFRKMNVIRSKKHELYTMQMNKVMLNAFDDKRYICEDGINTLAWGHYKIPRKRTHDEAFPEI
ncbi:hypothetical protein J437_LFUL003810 [Ladona fulva]|uniref:DNA-directed DNA polymerase n=1 Tax=Ladona fulva TaxID=123851 RepID=A0A8K0KF46_LADFU|nr:hypothetical protein J437_LFUL003810 [Ladona fulva]